MKPRVCITLDEELLIEIDEKRGDIPRSRFIERLVLRGVDSVDEEVPKGYA